MTKSIESSHGLQVATVQLTFSDARISIQDNLDPLSNGFSGGGGGGGGHQCYLSSLNLI